MKDQGRAGGMWMRLALAVALAGGLALFLAGHAAHVAPYYPRFFDQLSSYPSLYRVHHALADPSLALGDKLAAIGANLLDLRGWAVPLLATALGFVFGANRLAFASANYVFFAAIVAALAGAMARRFDVWTAGAAVGLLLTSRSVFMPTGGIHDLRMDLAGLAMFGIFVLALWRMAEQPDRRRVALAAVAYAATLWSRSVTGVYGLVAIAAFGAAALALAALGREPMGRDPVWRQRWRAALALGLVAAPIFAVYVAAHYQAIDSYYFNLLRTDEARIRLAENGLSSRAELLGYYLRSALLHFRPLVVWLAVTLGAVAAVIAVARLRGASAPAAAVPAALGPAGAVIGAAVVGVLFPLSVFAPSPVVIGVLTVPLAALGAAVLAAAKAASPWPRVANAAAMLPLVAGLWICGRSFASPPVWPAGAIAQAEAHDQLFERIHADGGGAIAWMTVSEGANWAGFSVRLYETGRAADVGRFRHAETHIFAMNAAAVLARIAASDGVVVWRSFPAALAYPAVASLRDTRDAWQPVLDRDFALRYEFAMSGGTIAYYRRVTPRPAARGPG